MFSNKFFQFAFLISLLTHGIILWQNTRLNILPAQKKEQNLEVSYLSKSAPLKKEPFLKIPKEISAKKAAPPPFIDKEHIFKKTNREALPESTLIKPAFIKPDIIAIKKKVTLPPITTDKINNPSYISYYQIVREKIRRAAYQNYTRTETGEVYISFIISSNGYLEEVRLVEERSSPSPYLRGIALRSLKDASPFPKFPKELDYPQLSFNVVISFEIE